MTGSDLIFVFLILGTLIAILIGGPKTFKRDRYGALVALFFAAPVWVMWAIIECFRGPVLYDEGPFGLGYLFGRRDQNVNVTVVNHVGEATTQHAVIQTDESQVYTRKFEVNGGGRIEPSLTRPLVETQIQEEMIICPHCAEQIRKKANICRFCNREV